MEVAPHAADVQPQPVEISPATGASLQPGSRDVRPDRVTPVDIQSRPVAAIDPRSPRADPPLEIGAPQPPLPADQDKGVFSVLKRIPDLLRPDPPAPSGENPRPPLPIGTASPEYEFPNNLRRVLANISAGLRAHQRLRARAAGRRGFTTARAVSGSNGLLPTAVAASVRGFVEPRTRLLNHTDP